MAEDTHTGVVADLYDLVPPVEPFAMDQGTNNRIMGVHTGQGSYVWKSYQPIHSERSICYEHGLLQWLIRHELPFAVPRPLPGRNGNTLQLVDGVFFALFQLIPGNRPAVDSVEQVEAIGAGLALLHKTLADYPATPRPGLTSFGALETVHPAIPSPWTITPADILLPDVEPFCSLCAWLREELAALRAFVDGTYQRLPTQMIHGDFGPSNTLLTGSRLSGIVDFEFALPDVRAMDLASGLVFTMRIWENGNPWPGAAALCRGYGSHVRLTEMELHSIPWLIRLRNGVSKIFWLGKALRTGDTREKTLSIQELQTYNEWLGMNENRLRREINE